MVLYLQTFSSYAGPALTNAREYQQPSGEKFQASIHGDENFHWIESKEGYVLKKNDDGFWYYAQINSKNTDIISSACKYGIDDKPSTSITAQDLKKINISISHITKILDRNSTKKTAKAVSAPNTYNTLVKRAPPVFRQNTENLVVFLVNFTDASIAYEGQWNSQIFGLTGKTLNDYFKKQSNNNFYFTPAQETNGTANDGIITVNLNYVHPTDTTENNDNTVVNVLNSANSYIDFSQYDTNNDGIISSYELHMVFILAGYEGSYSSTTPNVWAHRTGLDSSQAPTLDGKKVGDYFSDGGYCMMGEKHGDHMATIGTAAHELAHDIGLPDLYDTTPEPDPDSEGIGIHSLMASGSWGKVGTEAMGSTPTCLDAWSKVFVGFTMPTTINANGNYTVNSYTPGAYNVLKIPTSNINQYFLIENRQFLGYDEGLSNDCGNGGLAIWHIDEQVMQDSMEIYDDLVGINDYVDNKGVDLEEANEGAIGYSQLDTKDSVYLYEHYFHDSVANAVYDVSTGDYVTPNIFSNTTIPNSKLYDDTSTNISVTTDSDIGTAMSVNITGTTPIITINSGSASTTNMNVTLTLNSPSSSQMMISNNSNFSGGTWETYASSKSWTLLPGDGLKTVYVKFKDGLGNISTIFNSSITIAAGSPSAGSIVINTGDSITNTTTVSLAVYAINANQMMISNASDFAGASWESYATGRSWTLSSGDGVKTVYIKFKNLGGNESSAANDTITLDTTPPSGSSISINAGTACTGTISATLTISAVDAVQMMISNASDFAGASWEAYATSKSWTLALGDGTKTVYIKFKDAIGNVSAAVNDTITLDTTPPSGGSISISSGAAYTNSTNVVLSISAVGADQMMISNVSNFSGATWESYAASKNWVLAAGDGTKTVYIKFKDSVDNTSGSVNSSIAIETVLPTWPSQSALSAYNITSSSVRLSWLAANDNIGINGYKIYNSDSLLGTVTQSVYSNVYGSVFEYEASNLASSTSFTFKVQGVDLAGNSTTFLSTVATTLAGGGGGGNIPTPTIPATQIQDAPKEDGTPVQIISTLLKQSQISDKDVDTISANLQKITDALSNAITNENSEVNQLGTAAEALGQMSIAVGKASATSAQKIIRESIELTDAILTAAVDTSSSNSEKVVNDLSDTLKSTIALSKNTKDANSKEQIQEQIVKALEITSKLIEKVSTVKAIETVEDILDSTAARESDINQQTTQQINNSIINIAQTTVNKAKTQIIAPKINGQKAKVSISNKQAEDLSNRASQVNSQIDNMQSKMSEQSITAKFKKNILLSIPMQENIKSVDVIFGGSLTGILKGKGTETMDIATKVATISLPVEAINLNGNKTVWVSIKKLDNNSLSKKELAVVGNNPVYEFNSFILKNNQGQRIKQFNKPVEISIPYKLAAGQDSSKISVFYIDDKGKLYDKAGRYDASTKTVKFITGHFSKYIIKTKDNKVRSSDAVEKQWAKSYLETMTKKNSSNGTAANVQFQPKAYITRAEFAVLITKLFGIEYKNAACNFKDVKNNNWYYSAVASLIKDGIISDNSACKYFCPAYKLTRQDMIIMILRVAKKYKHFVYPEDIDKILSIFADRDKIKAFARKDVAAAVKYGLINGKPSLVRGKSIKVFASNEFVKQEEIRAIYRVLSLKSN
jgi:M6 family metalloprotease-like protein